MAFTAGPGMDQFTFIMALGIIIGFVYSFGIGSNDVAVRRGSGIISFSIAIASDPSYSPMPLLFLHLQNSFASSVSAKSLTLAQAIVIASIFEFLGAISIGAGVTGTIRHGIIKASHFADRPDLLMFGMLSSLIVGSIWLLSATYLEFPVSTTHTILGAIVGMSIAARGFDVSINNKMPFIHYFACATLNVFLSSTWPLTVHRLERSWQSDCRLGWISCLHWYLRLSFLLTHQEIRHGS